MTHITDSLTKWRIKIQTDDGRTWSATSAFFHPTYIRVEGNEVSVVVSQLIGECERRLGEIEKRERGGRWCGYYRANDETI